MNALKLAVAAAALVLGSGAASAATQNARGPISSERTFVDHVGAPNIVEGRGSEQKLLGTASRPTIFGHDTSRYVPSGDTVSVWGYPVDR